MTDDDTWQLFAPRVSVGVMRQVLPTYGGFRLAHAGTTHQKSSVVVGARRALAWWHSAYRRIAAVAVAVLRTEVHGFVHGKVRFVACRIRQMLTDTIGSGLSV